MAKPVINIKKDGDSGNIFAILGRAHAALMEEGFKALKECKDYMLEGDLISHNFVMAGEIMKNKVFSAPSYEAAIKAIDEFVTINWV